MASLNKVILMGNLTADPELKTTPSGVSVTTFTVACQRRYVKDAEEQKADFINVVAWRNTAEFVSRYFTKGKNIIVCGSIQTRNYTAQDGTKRYITEVVADDVSFGANATGERRDRNDGTFYGGGVDQMTPPQPRVSEANFEEVAAEDDLPF